MGGRLCTLVLMDCTLQMACYDDLSAEQALRMPGKVIVCMESRLCNSSGASGSLGCVLKG